MSNDSNSNDSSTKREAAVEYYHTAGVVELFRRLNLSLAVTTYQAQRVFTFSANQSERLSMLMRVFERPTGLAFDGRRLALGTRNQIWIFESSSEIYDQGGIRFPADLTFVPRRSYVTGDVAVHEAAFIEGTLHFVNTRFSCIARTSEKWSFEPVWRPRFISKLAADDRCHLNGFALSSGGIKLVSALGATDEAAGWRARKADGGVVIDYPSGEIVAAELSMPHSPRIFGGKSWILESGVGELQLLDLPSGVRQTVCRVPGYPRGLAFADRYAFVGLSKIREKNMFGGLKIETLFPELQCGVVIIDLTTGALVGGITFTRGIEEIFDIQVLPGIGRPEIIGFEEETVQGLYILPPGI